MGLHRDLVTNVTLRIDNEIELRNNSLIFREMISNNTYIYLEELFTKKKSMEFWPDSGIDIEKPSTVSKEQQFIWRLPLVDCLNSNDYVTDVQYLDSTDLKPLDSFDRIKSIQDIKSYPIVLKATIKFEIHLRY